MRIVEELSSFYRHIYLNLPGFTRLVGVAGAGVPLRFGVFPANLYKIGEPTSGLEPLTSSHYEEVFDPRGHDLDFCLSNSVFLGSHQFYVLGAVLS